MSQFLKLAEEIFFAGQKLSKAETLLYVFAVSGVTTPAQNAVMTSNTAPAHPHMTVVAMYLALFP